MSEEIKCNCQHCNERISFPIEMAGHAIACPHCGLETKFFVPPAPVLPDSTSSGESPGQQLRAERPAVSGVVACGYIFSFLLPLAGFFLGVYLMAKKKPGHGTACMALSIVLGGAWLTVLSMKGHPQATNPASHRVEDTQQKADENLRPVQGAYGWNLGAKLADGLEIKTNEDLFYYSPVPGGDWDGWLILTEDRRVASITQCFHNDSTQFDKVMGVLREKYGLRHVSHASTGKDLTAWYGTTNRQAMLTISSAVGTSFLEYSDQELCRVADEEKFSRTNAAATKAVKQIEDGLKAHL